MFEHVALLCTDSSVIGRIPSWSELLAPNAPYKQKEVSVSAVVCKPNHTTEKLVSCEEPPSVLIGGCHGF